MNAHSQPFLGFEPLHSNYVYCPNQFFDVCMPYCSRGTVRIVAYILRQTLGWLDADGNPIHTEVTVTYRDLIEKAGVSRGAIGPAMAEALEFGLLETVGTAQPKSKGQPAVSSSLKLRWSTADRYQKQIVDFDGFYSGEGHRSPIPNTFFDQLVRSESLAVVKVVGTVLRHTVGYQAQFGGRRSSAPLAYSYIAKYAQLSAGRVLSGAIQTARERGYIACTQPGVFGTKVNHREAARYAVRWLGAADSSNIGSKKPPFPNQSKKAIDIGSKPPPADRFKKATEETTPTEDSNKQQPAAEFDRKKSVTLLVAEGFDRPTAERLSDNFPEADIANQITWLDARNPQKSRIGMLRKAIENNWPKPESIALKEKQRDRRSQDEALAEQQRKEQAATVKRKGERAMRRRLLLDE